MRIISKFHDYYDGVMQHGFDESVVYVRQPSDIDLENTSNLSKSCRDLFKEIEIKCRQNIRYAKPTWYKDTFIEFHNPVAVMVCDKFYHGVRVTIRKSGSIAPAFDAYVFSIDQLVRTCEQLKLSDAVEDINIANKQRLRGNKYGYILQPRRFKLIASWLSGTAFETVTACENAVLAVARDERVVCLSCTNVGVAVNPRLAEYNFACVMPPFELAQEISMFIGGVLGSPAGALISIGDADKIQQHGFDEWSFRTLPTKHKK